MENIWALYGYDYYTDNEHAEQICLVKKTKNNNNNKTPHKNEQTTKNNNDSKKPTNKKITTKNNNKQLFMLLI